MKKFFSLVLALVMALSLTTVAWGADVSYTVDSSNPVSATNFHTLEDAVAAVNAGDNATITLLEDVELATMLVVNVAANITIDGNGNEITTSTSFASDYVLHLCGPAANTYKVVDVTFNACEANIAIVKVEPATAYFNCDFTACEAQTMIYAKNADATLEGCNFTGNTSNYVSGGNFALVTLFCPAVVSDCVFTGNTAYTNGMVYFKYSPVAEATNNVFESNVIENTVQNAAVIYADELTASGNTFEGNEVSAPNRAAVVVADMGEVSGNVFSGNDVDGAAGKTATVVAKGDPDTDLDVNSNYWDGGAPAVANDGDGDIAADVYYTTAVGGALGGLTGVASTPASAVKGAYLTANMATMSVYPGLDLDNYTYSLEHYVSGNAAAKTFDQKALWSTNKVTQAKVIEAVFVVAASAESADYAFVNGAQITYLSDVAGYTGNVTVLPTVDAKDAAKCGDMFVGGDYAAYTDANGKLYVEKAGGAVYNVGGKYVELDEVTVAGGDLVPCIVDTLQANPANYVDYVLYVVGHEYGYNTKTVAGKTTVTAVFCKECKGEFAFLEGTEAQAIAKFGAGNYNTVAAKLFVAKTAGAAVGGTTAGDKVQSAETFDAGIAMYVGMSVMAAAGSVVVLKKRED